MPPLTERLARLLPLSATEIEVLRELQGARRRVGRGREIVAEGRRYDGLLILFDGVALRYRVLHDGRRQVLNVVLPGDLIGFPGCFFENALYTIAALSDCTVSAVPFARLIVIGLATVYASCLMALQFKRLSVLPYSVTVPVPALDEIASTGLPRS